MRLKNVVLLVLLIMAPAVKSAETPSTALLILAKSEQALYIVDPGTQAVVAKVSAGPDPHEIVASEDGKFAYISNYGGGSLNTISVVELVKQKTLQAIDLGALRGPHGLVFVDGKVWFTAEAARVVGSYDPATQKIDWVLGTGQDRTHMIYVFRGHERMATSNVNSATVTLIEKDDSPRRGPGPPPGGPGMPAAQGPAGSGPGARASNWIETVIPVGDGAEGFDVSPDGKEIWVANAQDGTISIIDVADKKVVQTLDANVAGANRLKFTPDGKLVLVSTLRGGDLTVLSAASRKEVKRIAIGHGAAGILMQPDGLRAYVACTPDDYVVAIDLKTLELAGKIAVGKEPDGLAWAVRR